jgi:F0F1-type ATP synthase membrane subunit c/vacuolar-type H+-ATPase subunit K
VDFYVPDDCLGIMAASLSFLNAKEQFKSSIIIGAVLWEMLWVIGLVLAYLFPRLFRLLEIG